MKPLLIAVAATLAVFPGSADFAASSESKDKEGPAIGVRISTTEIVGPDFNDVVWRTKILLHVRDLIQGRTDTALGIASGDGRHLVMVSLARQGKTAIVARGEGEGLEPALRKAASKLRSHLTPSEIKNGKLKVDLALGADPIERFDAEGRADIDRSLDGIWLLDADFVLLPEELLSRRLMDSSGDLQSKRLRSYLAEGARAPAVTVEGNPGKIGSAYRKIRFTSFIEGADLEPVQLYRGNRRNPGWSPPELLEAADHGGRYLLRHQRVDGSFDYSYEPKKDTVSADYNLLRHAGSSYALVELYQLTGDDRYATHAARIAEAIVAAQRTVSPHPDWIGSFYDPPRSTPTATRAEGLAAATRLARRTGKDATPFLEALQRMAAFQLRCQITSENDLYLARPDLARGGFRRSLTDWEIRIDYVQHNVSALLGLRSLLVSSSSEDAAGAD